MPIVKNQDKIKQLNVQAFAKVPIEVVCHKLSTNVIYEIYKKRNRQNWKIAFNV